MRLVLIGLLLLSGCGARSPVCKFNCDVEISNAETECARHEKAECAYKLMKKDADYYQCTTLLSVCKCPWIAPKKFELEN